MIHVAEIVTFALVGGVTLEDFVKLNQGFRRIRPVGPWICPPPVETRRGCHLDRFESAQNAAAQFGQQDCSAAVIVAIDPESTRGVMRLCYGT